MAGFVLSREAREDTLAIWLYLSQQASDDVADQQLDRIYDTCAKLAANPYIGRSRSELRKDLRSFPENPYMIFYTVEGPQQDVLIRRVIHSSRDIDRQFSGES